MQPLHFGDDNGYLDRSVTCEYDNGGNIGESKNYVGIDMTGDDTSGALEYNGRQLVKATQGNNGYEIFSLKENLSGSENRLRINRDDPHFAARNRAFQ